LIPGKILIPVSIVYSPATVILQNFWMEGIMLINNIFNDFTGDDESGYRRHEGNASPSSSSVLEN